MPFRCDMRFEKGQKRRIRTRVDRVKKNTRYRTCAAESDTEPASFLVMTNSITRWWAELV